MKHLLACVGIGLCCVVTAPAGRAAGAHVQDLACWRDFQGVEYCTTDSGQTHIVRIELANWHVRFHVATTSDATGKMPLSGADFAIYSLGPTWSSFWGRLLSTSVPKLISRAGALSLIVLNAATSTCPRLAQIYSITSLNEDLTSDTDFRLPRDLLSPMQVSSSEL